MTWAHNSSLPACFYEVDRDKVTSTCACEIREHYIFCIYAQEKSFEKNI
jgi:hypothetical protein